jgi:hypothetical protein
MKNGAKISTSPTFHARAKILQYFVLAVFGLCVLQPTPLLSKTATAYSGLQVSLAPLIRGDKEKFGIQPAHPADLPLSTIKKNMAQLAYQKREFLWSKKKHVFTPDAIDLLAPRIREKLTQADSSTRITFQMKDAAGHQIVLRGDTFLTLEGLHWRITQLHDDSREIDEFNLFGGPWRLAPLKNQEYKESKKFLFFTGAMTNWIIAKKIETQPSDIRVKGQKDPAEKETQALVQERLEMLKELKQEGLISDEDYHTKQREILEGF